MGNMAHNQSTSLAFYVIEKTLQLFHAPPEVDRILIALSVNLTAICTVYGDCFESFPKTIIEYAELNGECSDFAVTKT